MNESPIHFWLKNFVKKAVSSLPTLIIVLLAVVLLVEFHDFDICISFRIDRNLFNSR